MCWCAHQDCLTLLRWVQGEHPAQAAPPSLPWKMLTNQQTELFNEDISNPLINFSRNAQITPVQRWSLLQHSLHANTFDRPVFGATNRFSMITLLCGLSSAKPGTLK